MEKSALYLAPLQNADIVIQIHATMATLAVLLGPVAIYRARRDLLHKVVGYVWILAMTATIGTSFFINGLAVIGPFGPIHILSVLAAFSIWKGVAHILAGRVQAHQREMRSLYWTGLVVAGVFAFLPGRIVNQMLFPKNEHIGYVVLVIALVCVAARLVLIRQRGKGRLRNG